MACYERCGEFAVTPVLVTPCEPSKCCEEPPICYPCLPRCTKGEVVYCCQKRRPRTPPHTPACNEHRDSHYDGNHHGENRHRSYNHDCSPPRNHRPRSPPPSRQSPRYDQNPPECCQSCCHPTCRPVKMKYVIPCYRYEDGRIVNQPTILMRRACEVATGIRPRRRPYIVSSYCADADNEVRRYACEDERGNCCYHFEKKSNNSDKSCCPSMQQPKRLPCTSCHSAPACQYVDCVQARAIAPGGNCYFCS